MLCRTCKHCVVVSRSGGFCHFFPPVFFNARSLKATGEDRIDARPDQWVQLIHSYGASAFPPVDPTITRCGQHRFSIRTWLRWRRAPALVPGSLNPVVQEKS